MKVSNLQFFILCIVLLTSTSCYTYRNTGLLQENNRKLPVYETSDYKKYKIRINDEIIYRIITIDETVSKIMPASAGSSTQNMLSYRVHSDGTVDLPFLNRVPVEGLTIEEAEKTVGERMRQIIPDAEIKLTLANKTFTVIGDISSGIFPVYKERLTIFQAIALSGDLLQSGDRRHVRILRESDEGTKILEFDIRPASIIESEYYYIYPNDIVYIRRSPSSFYKVANYGSFLGLITSSITLFFTVLYYTK
ncbi:MAG: polysaccharide biosynthesis/export family protein [Prevotellaceae bacterium]|jgi:polysaccharide export outer membrane protein|nr:polysaccharide biosynthesis/export family protein [Prevotellaceae bacterium]